MKKLFRHGFVILVVFMLLSAGGRAQVIFTFTGTADPGSDGTARTLGYTSNQAVTISFTLPQAFPYNANFVGNSTQYSWMPTTTPIFASITGTGITGTYDALDNQALGIYAVSSPPLLLEGGTYTGLFVNGAALKLFVLAAYPAPFPFTFSGSSYVDPATYFAANAGSYALAATSHLNLFDVNDHGNTITLTQMTITVVPEPAEAAVWVGGCAMAAAGMWRMWRRNRKTA